MRTILAFSGYKLDHAQGRDVKELVNPLIINHSVRLIERVTGRGAHWGLKAMRLGMSWQCWYDYREVGFYDCKTQEITG